MIILSKEEEPFFSEFKSLPLLWASHMQKMLSLKAVWESALGLLWIEVTKAETNTIAESLSKRESPLNFVFNYQNDTKKEESLFFLCIHFSVYVLSLSPLQKQKPYPFNSFIINICHLLTSDSILFFLNKIKNFKKTSPFSELIHLLIFISLFLYLWNFDSIYANPISNFEEQKINYILN